MNVREPDRATTPALNVGPVPRRFWVSVAHMVLLWIALGVVVGAGAVPGGVIAVAAGIVAGIIVLTPMGLMLGLMGGAAKENLIGSLFGLIVGVLVAAIKGDGQIATMANVGLIGGGFAGATSGAIFRRLKQLKTLLFPAPYASKAA